MISDIILANNDHYYRCNGRKLNVCPKCVLRFNCWTRYKRKGGNLDNIKDDFIYIDISNHYSNTGRKRKIIEYMFGATEGFTFSGTCGDITYENNLIIEGAWKIR